ncbi:MAG: SIS domain-containing protein [Candidatus Omnitrophica bacterium]|nr:SIS domain-containing protein [Candidatus Omnitrophota bacterium]
MKTAVEAATGLELIASELEDSAQTKIKLKEHAEAINAIAAAMVKALRRGGKIVFFGNGGSAADAQHLAAEFVGQFHDVRPGLPAMSLTVNTSVLTAIGNDFSFEEIFSRQVEALVTADDVAVAISTGGYSPLAGKFSKNVVRGVEEAKKKGATTVGLLGKSGGLLATMVDLPLVVPSQNTQRIQEAHITIGHILCTLTEKGLAEEGASA